MNDGRRTEIIKGVLVVLLLGACGAVAILAGIKAGRRESAAPEEKVRVYDVRTKTLRQIPASELTPGMAPVHIEGVEGTVWIKPLSAQAREERPSPNAPSGGK